jgi:hypothetical protein
MLAGRQGLASIARWGRECSMEQLKQLGIDREQAPCHATWHNVFKVVDSNAMEQAFARWTQQDVPQGAVISIDGKTLRGSQYADYPAVHLLSAYCDAISSVLGQRLVKTDKANEITEAVALLKAIPVEGNIITGDAMFTQKSICQAILDRGGDYVFPVKDNQPGLHQAIEEVFNPADSPTEKKSRKRR